MEIGNIPTGLWMSHNVEMIVGQGASTHSDLLVQVLTVISQEGEYTQVKMPSGEIRLVHKKC
jgi:large subunit ribosomal protein L2